MANAAEAAPIAGETMDAFANFRRLAKATKPRLDSNPWRKWHPDQR